MLGAGISSAGMLPQLSPPRGGRDSSSLSEGNAFDPMLFQRLREGQRGGVVSHSSRSRLFLLNQQIRNQISHQARIKSVRSTVKHLARQVNLQAFSKIVKPSSTQSGQVNRGSQSNIQSSTA